MVKRENNPRNHVTTVQKRFEADLYKRIIRDSGNDEALKPAIKRRVVEEDMLGLQRLMTDGGAAAQFDFPENPGRTADFEDWLQRKIDDDVLMRMDRKHVVSAQHWTADYMRDSAQQGIQHADREMRRARIEPEDEPVGTVLRQPQHQDLVQTGYIRVYDELEDVSSTMANEISRSMSEGLSEGFGSEKTARRMNERTDVGMTRSRRISRTETNNAYNNHSAVRFEEHGVQKLRIVTNNPCEICSALAAGGPYSPEEAMNLLPNETHPNCVCSLAVAS